MTDQPAPAAPSPEQDRITDLAKRRAQILVTWAVLYQELGGESPIVGAQQAALDDVTRQLRLLRQEHQPASPAIGPAPMIGAQPAYPRKEHTDGR